MLTIILTFYKILSCQDLLRPIAFLAGPSGLGRVKNLVGFPSLFCINTVTKNFLNFHGLIPPQPRLYPNSNTKCRRHVMSIDHRKIFREEN
ncbi:hypothetical protein RIR_jg29094.t1 [Rhizophagus irregularis DAOM 181602=DAOM 197198]|uniref:Uncharacterized protein n=1 Tax=Rhizophagus irregularis (strain DAOM 181602 / DAOM 197198 / MUCL 43194) TaxID=747089 RepID=U9UGA4_RHIID|nr:hypothetical protein RIR_jg29094.t1 [Rhizophagus irregularis DAOM 181602=DAOM 197198]